MDEEYVDHNIVQKDNTTVMLENIYARQDWVPKDFPDRESTVHGTYDDLELIHSLKIMSTYNSCYESAGT